MGDRDVKSGEKGWMILLSAEKMIYSNLLSMRWERLFAVIGLSYILLLSNIAVGQQQTRVLPHKSSNYRHKQLDPQQITAQTPRFPCKHLHARRRRTFRAV